MPPPLRRPLIPQCTACLRNHAFGTIDIAPPPSRLHQQTRGKKKMANNSATLPVRLLRDLATFGRKGAIVPIARGQMRNQWFPQSIAAYITIPEQRTLRLSTTSIERDFNFGVSGDEPTPDDVPADTVPADIKDMSRTELQSASAFQKAPVIEKLSPQRSMELVEIFLPKRVDFYRQPIPEDKEAEEAAAAEAERTRFRAGGAAGDLLAARQRVPVPEKRRAIYGSVALQDVLAAMREALNTNDEAARVALQEGEVEFVGLEGSEETGKVLKYVGEYGVEIKVKGAESSVRRTVRVIAQEM